MSPDGSSVGVFSTDRIGRLGYGLGFTIGILVLVTTILVATYLCNRSSTTTRSPPRRSARPAGETRVTDVEAGLDENILMSYPKLLYSQARLHEKETTGSCCTICLADYKDTDMLRGLPDCSHMFHVNCIDPWLRLHPTCPVCRASPLPTPLPTPLAETQLSSRDFAKQNIRFSCSFPAEAARNKEKQGSL
ncbi:RING-H2 finger protein ATL70-like [Cocos nucifera]|nr:RING-H2 finger protein ATL70-like [Cocos nucifera]